MKLLYCPHCWDVRKLLKDAPVFCVCARSWGRYTNDIEATFGGDAVMLGISNGALARARLSQASEGDRADGKGRMFAAFILPEGSPMVTREEVIDAG